MKSDQKNVTRKLSIADLSAAAEIMAEAYHEDPLWLYLIPNEKKRKIIEHRFFKAFLTLQFNSWEYYGVSYPLKGVALWKFPNPPTIRTREKIRMLFKSGLIRFVFSRFLLKYIKIVGIFNRMEALHTKYAVGPHYYLSSIGVRPQDQGKGFASNLIKPILLKVDQESMSVYLETLTPENVPIYKHFGFKIMEKVEFPKENLTVWAFYRPPKK